MAHSRGFELFKTILKEALEHFVLFQCCVSMISSLQRQIFEKPMLRRSTSMLGMVTLRYKCQMFVGTEEGFGRASVVFFLFKKIEVGKNTSIGR